MESEREEGITQRIRARIEKCEKRRARLAPLKTAGAGLVWTASLSALVPFGKMLISELTRSGFLDLALLIRSDLGTVAASWSEFFLALLESAPVTSALPMLAALLAFSFSTRTLWTSRVSHIS